MQKTIRSTRICAASMCLCQGLTFSSLEQKCALQLTCYATAGGRLAAVHEPRMAPVHVRPACLAPGLTRHGFLLGNHVHGQHGHGSRCLLAWGSGRGAPQNPGRLLPGPAPLAPVLVAPGPNLSPRRWSTGRCPATRSSDSRRILQILPALLDCTERQCVLLYNI